MERAPSPQQAANPGSREHRRVSAACAAASGVVLAIVTSGGILGERLSAGDPRVGALVDALVTAACVFVLCTTRRAPRAVLGVQIAGAFVGIALVHLALRFGVVHGAPWLSESAPQLANDVTAALASLLLVRACARELDARVLGLALVLVTAYRATAGMWHVDVAPHGFAMTVQELVVAQFVACAAGLLVFTQLRRLVAYGPSR